MSTHSFSIIASGLDHEADDFEDRLYEAGCDDATVSVQQGAIILDFDREAPGFNSAIKSAIRDVERAGATVVQVEPTHLVSPADVAARAGLTRAAISNYAMGKRGKSLSSFPAPLARVTTSNPLWDWAEVATWLWRDGKVRHAEVHKAKIVRGYNCRLEASRSHCVAPFGARSRAAHDVRSSTDAAACAFAFTGVHP